MLISYSLPTLCVKNDDLAYLGWSSEKIFAKTGINSRYVCHGDESALSLAAKACEQLLKEHSFEKNSIEFLLYCTQSPDTLIPTNACVLQNQLGLEKSIGALDFNLGCSGFVYGLSLAKGILETGQANTVLLVTTETYSKYIDAQDRSNRILFGDAASATLLTKKDAYNLGPFVFGTDGSGAENLCLKATPNSDKNTLHMNGAQILSFVLSEIPPMLHLLLKRANLTMDQIDHFIFHQANAYVINTIRDKLDIPQKKVSMCMEDVGNTVSSSIPITLYHLMKQDKIQPGSILVFIGFGVGYSWIGCVFKV